MVKKIKKNPAVACFISVRTSSRRLPGKVLLKIRGRRVIEHVIDRAKRIKGIKDVILCTSTDPKDKILYDIAIKNGIKAHRGPLKDRFMRWLGAADKFGVDYFVEFDADDLFCDPELMELSIAEIKKKPCGLLTFPDTSVTGGAAVSLSTDALRLLCKAKNTKNTVVPWSYISETGLVSSRILKIKDKIFHTQSVRLTLDYPEDLLFFKKVFKEMDIKTNTVPLRDILIFLAKRPDIVKINLSRHNDYVANFRKIPKLKLKPGF